jgi:hypothetical protein
VPGTRAAPIVTGSNPWSCCWKIIASLEQPCLDLRKLVDDRTRVVNEINDCLKEFYPKALRLSMSRTVEERG